MMLKNINLFAFAGIAFWLFIMQSFPALAETNVAAILQNLNGVVHVRSAQGMDKLAYEQMAVGIGDTIITEKEASAMLLFADKGQLGLRPASEFLIKAFHYDEAKPKEDNLVISLLKGGLRMITGYVSKRGNRDAYRLESATATMGIRGTDFTARLCDSDCDIDQAQHQQIAPSIAGIIGRVAVLDGELKRSQLDQITSLTKFAPLFENDELQMEVGSHAILVFIDGSRIVMQTGSKLKISKYHYEPLKPESNIQIVNLLRGGVRVGLGLIGQQAPENVQFIIGATTVNDSNGALDIVCGRKKEADCDAEFFVHSRIGQAIIKAVNYQKTIQQGQTAYVPAPEQAPLLTEEIPPIIKENALPLPEKMPVEMQTLFGYGTQKTAPGLYALVNDGSIVLTDASKGVVVGKGETVYSPLDGNPPVLIPITPALLNNDEVLGNMAFIQGLCDSK